MNAVGLTILRPGGRCDSLHLEARNSGVLVVSNDKFEVQIQVNRDGDPIAVTTQMLGPRWRSRAFASVVLSTVSEKEVTCE